jgi:uncharacterized membrane protein YphA (DoxX/SURF4 family)
MTLSNRTPAGVAAYILRVLLGVIFVYAAWMKLREPWALFAMAIDSYQVLPMWAVEAVARTLPYAEALLGVLLIAGLWRRFSTVCASLLLAVFFVLMVRALAKGMQIDCGCFGPGERLSWITLLRDGALLAGSLFVTVWNGLQAWGRRPRRPLRIIEVRTIE